jgi:hypothetical protein
VEAEMIFDCYAISSFIRATATAPMILKPFLAVSPMARGFAAVMIAVFPKEQTAAP